MTTTPTTFHTVEELRALDLAVASHEVWVLDGETEAITGLHVYGNGAVHVDLADGTGRWFDTGESITAKEA